ncbi:ABC transporter permease [Candidatus Contubernalis alkaliaceticus]|uniref:ABC transporter permease n=1 Tax=Candidatus Contubernalis alkaliaceticus TaxID=338645 RepID=UPI001F4C05AB|nr:ABC transporter permease [Candidatus Contubernalis alkalaceticus]UNC92159.1 ABC transporter permease [Candidatus Contubernalis alkalaceticus]
MYHALIIFLKDVKDMVRNMSFIFIIMMPLIIGGGYTYLLPDGLISVGYLGEAPVFLAEMAETEEIYLREYTRENELKEALGRNIQIGVILPQGYQEALEEGNPKKITILENTENHPLANMILFMYLSAAGEQVMPDVEVERIVKDDETPPRGMHTQISVISVVMGLVMIGTLLVPSLIVEEKEKGTLRAMVTAGISFPVIITSKAITGFLLCSIVGLLTALVSSLNISSPGVFFTFLILGAILTTLTGLIVGGLTEDLMTLNEISSMVMIFLLVPVLLQNVALHPIIEKIMMVIPTNWIIDAFYLSLLPAVDWGRLYLPLFILTAANCILFFAAVITLRRASERVA